MQVLLGVPAVFSSPFVLSLISLQTCQQLLWPLPSPLEAFRAKGKDQQYQFFPQASMLAESTTAIGVSWNVSTRAPNLCNTSSSPRDPPCSELWEEKAQVVPWKPLESCLAYPTLPALFSHCQPQHHRSVRTALEESNLGGY